MARKNILDMAFSDVYPMLVKKAERKNRKKEEVEEVFFWLTGYDKKGLEKVLKDNLTYRQMFDQAPNFNPKAKLITGTICGIRVEEIEDPYMQKLRYLDKLVDELAKGRDMEKILRK